MNQPAVRAFHFRYTIKTIDGGMTQTDRVSDQPFWQPVGSCVSLPSLTLMSPSVCEGDVGAFRAKYLKPANAPGTQTTAVASRATNTKKASSQGGAQMPTPSAMDTASVVRCKIGTAGVLQTSAQNCMKAEGQIIP